MSENKPSSFPCYHILSAVDGGIDCQLNRTKEQVNDYLSAYTPDDIKYGRIKILVSLAGAYETEIETKVKLTDNVKKLNDEN